MISQLQAEADIPARKTRNTAYQRRKSPAQTLFMLNMKALFFTLLLLATTNSYAQKYLIQGIALDSTRGKNKVTIIRNDTIRKYLRNNSRNPEAYGKLWQNSSYVVRTGKDGLFRIRAAKTDTLRFESYRHIPQNIPVRNLLKSKNIRITLIPQPCEPYVACHDTMPEQLVFIGRKISVNQVQERQYCNRISLDRKFDAVYTIVEKVSGNLLQDTIHFSSYDHYGRPKFEEYEYVMIFAGKYCENIIQHKYQFYNVYKTRNSQWAAPYQALDYSRLDPTSALKPEIIPFEHPVEIDLTQESREWIDKWYPAPYYRIENNKAIAVYGNYVKDLLHLKYETHFNNNTNTSKANHLNIPVEK